MTLEKNKLKAILRLDSDSKSILEFQTSDAKAIELESIDQTELQKVFAAILKDLLLNDIYFDLEIDNSFPEDRTVDRKACMEYIKQLNEDLSESRSYIKTTLQKDTEA